MKKDSLFPILFMLCVFLAQPLLLIGNFSRITFFASGTLVLLAAGFLFTDRAARPNLFPGLPKDLQITWWILLVSGLLHSAAAGYFAPELFGLNLLYAVIPLFAAVYLHETKKFLPRLLTLLFVWNFVLVVFQFFTGTPPFGLTGNWNWSVILSVGAAPSAALLLAKRLPQKTAFAIIGTVLVFLLVLADSRSAWLMCAGMVYLFLLLKFPGRRMGILSAGVVLVLCGAGALCFFPQKLSAFLAREVRPEIWIASCKLILRHPLGVGAAGFENAVIPFKTQAYFLKLMAAVRTTHPHNEFLFAAAALGIPAALAWLWWNVRAISLFIRRFRPGTNSAVEIALFLAYGGFLLTAMFDLTFQSWPLAVLAQLAFGTFAFPGRAEAQPFPERKSIRLTGKLLICFSVYSACTMLAGTILFECAKDAFRGGNTERGNKCALFAASAARNVPEQLSDTAFAAFKAGKPGTALALTNLFEQTPWKDYAHIHGLRAMIFASSGNDEFAVDEYRAESACFPFEILPLIGWINAEGRLGRTENIPDLQARLDSVIKIRNLTPEDVRRIMRDPTLDRQNPVPQETEKHE